MVPGNRGLQYLTTITMGNLLYLFAVVLVILWLVGYYGFNAGEFIHLLIVIAFVVVLLRIIAGRRL